MYLVRRRAAPGRVPLPAARRGRCASFRRTSSERVLLAVDCANERRIGPEPELVDRAGVVVNVDHHHDNTRFGGVNLVVDDASSTAEIVRDILGALDVPLTPEIAEALYVGLVTDTGRFQYTNTTPKALRLAAELVEAGAERARHLPPRLRDGAVREAEAARTRARACPALRGRPARRLVPPARRLRRGRRGGAVLRGDHRLAARRRGLRDGGADPRAAARRRAGAAHLAPLEPRRGGRVGDRTRARRRRPPPGGRVLVRGVDRRDRRRSCTASSSASRPSASRAMPPRALKPGRRRAARTSRPGRRRSRSSPTCAAGPARAPATRARSIRSRRGSSFCCPERQLDWLHASSVWTSATSPTSTSRRRPRPATRKGRRRRAALAAGAGRARRCTRAPPR